MSDKSNLKIGFNTLTIILVATLIIIVGIIFYTNEVNIVGSENLSSENPSTMTVEIINFETDPNGVYKVQLKLKGSNIPEGQKNYFKIVGNLNGTPADELWFDFPEGSKLANGMIITLAGPEDFSEYDSFTIYLYDQPLYDENMTNNYPNPIFSITINNTAYKN